MKSKTKLGAKILSARKEKSMTQADLASKVGVSRAAISQFELGDTLPSTSTVIKLAEALGCELHHEWQETTPVDAVIENTVKLKFYPINSYPYLSTLVDDEPLDWLTKDIHVYVADNTLSVLQLPGYDYEGTFVVEVKGNSMMPRYPHGSRYVVRGVGGAGLGLKFSSGVHMILLAGQPPIFRRIVSTAKDKLLLRADATGEEMELPLRQVEDWMSTHKCAFFKLGQAVHLPIEE